MRSWSSTPGNGPCRPAPTCTVTGQPGGDSALFGGQRCPGRRRCRCGVAREAVDDRPLLGAVGVDRSIEELVGLLLGSGLREVLLEEYRRFARVGVQPGGQTLALDLADPRVEVLRAIDAVSVQLVAEIGVW